MAENGQTIIEIAKKSAERSLKLPKTQPKQPNMGPHRVFRLFLSCFGVFQDHKIPTNDLLSTNGCHNY
jgi:hypothetical protein